MPNFGVTNRIFLDRRTIYGYRIDIQTDKQTVDAYREGSQHSLLYVIGV